MIHRGQCPKRAPVLPNRCIENKQCVNPFHIQPHNSVFDNVVVVAVVVVVIVVAVLVVVVFGAVVVVVVAVDSRVHLSKRHDKN